MVQAHSRSRPSPAQNLCPHHQPRSLCPSQVTTQVRLAAPKASRLNVISSHTSSQVSKEYQHQQVLSLQASVSTLAYSLLHEEITLQGSRQRPLLTLLAAKTLADYKNPSENQAVRSIQQADLDDENIPLANGDMMPPVEAVYSPRTSGEIRPGCEFQWTEERPSSFSHTQHVDKEWNAGLRKLSHRLLQTRRKIYDLLLFDTCTVHTKYRTTRELVFIEERTMLIDQDTSYHDHYCRRTSEESEHL